MASFTHALQRSCFENLVLVSVYDGKVAAAACANTSVGALTHYREFKFALVSALAGLGPEGSKPPDVAFILDLTDRAAIRLKDDVPKLASSAGACAQSLPAPISLKGYGSNTWQEELRTPAGGAGWKWAHADWHAKDARASGAAACARTAIACSKPLSGRPRRARCARATITRASARTTRRRPPPSSNAHAP